MILMPFIPLPVMGVLCILLLVMKRRGVWNYIKQIVIVLLLFAINMRLMLPTDKVVVADNGVDILFVVDNTVSMLAEDYGKNNERRIDAVKSDVHSIVDEFPSARYALITFNNTADLIVPYTTEQQLLFQSVDNLEGILANNAEGTSLNLAYTAIDDTLYRNLELYEDEDKNFASQGIPKRTQVVIFISDGEITNFEKLESFEPLRDYMDTGAVLGYGTTKGGTMKVPDIAGEYQDLYYLNDNFDLELAKSSIDEDNLETIAEDMDVKYYHMESGKDVKKVTNDIAGKIDDGEFITIEKKMEAYKETYHYFAMALILFVSVDYLYTRIKMRRER